MVLRFSSKSASGSLQSCGSAARWPVSGRTECRLPASPSVHPAIAATVRNPPDVTDAARAKIMDVTGKNGLATADCTCSNAAYPSVE